MSTPPSPAVALGATAFPPVGDVVTEPNHRTATAHAVQAVLAAEYHSGEPCDCYGPDRDRAQQECAAWADNILRALRAAGFTVRFSGVGGAS